MSYLTNLITNNSVLYKRTNKNKPLHVLSDNIIKGPYNPQKFISVTNRAKILSEWKTPLVLLPKDINHLLDICNEFKEEKLKVLKKINTERRLEKREEERKKGRTVIPKRYLISKGNIVVEELDSGVDDIDIGTNTNTIDKDQIQDTTDTNHNPKDQNKKPKTKRTRINLFGLNDEMYIDYDNIYKNTKFKTSNYTETFSNYSYNVVKIDKTYHILKLSQIFKLNDFSIYANESLLVDIIYTLCHLYVLSTGDIHTGSILYDKKKNEVYIMDYDDSRKKLTDDRVFYFTKDDPNWYEKTSYLYPLVAKRIKEFVSGFDEEQQTKYSEYIPKFEMVIDMLIKYTGKKQEYGNMGEMKWNGLLSKTTTTFSGYHIDEIKSGLEKYIIIGDFNNAILCASELYRMREIGGKVCQTSLINKLVQILVTYIGIANIKLVISLLEYIRDSGIGVNCKAQTNKVQTKDSNHNASTSKAHDKDINFDTIAKIIKLMCDSPKTKIASHLWYTYSDFKCYKMLCKSNSYNLKVDTNFTKEDIDIIKENLLNEIFVETDSEEMRAYILTFITRLEEKDYNCFVWLKRFFDSCNARKKDADKPMKRKTILGKTTSDPIIIFWIMIQSVLDNYSILEWGYYNFNKDINFVLLATVCYLFDISYNNDLNITNTRVKYNTDTKLVLDDFIYDYTTSKGKENGKTLMDNIGFESKMNNIDDKYKDMVYAKIYYNRDMEDM